MNSPAAAMSNSAILSAEEIRQLEKNYQIQDLPAGAPSLETHVQ